MNIKKLCGVASKFFVAVGLLSSLNSANAGVILFADQYTGWNGGDLPGTVITSSVLGAGNTVNSSSLLDTVGLAAADSLWVSTANAGSGTALTVAEALNLTAFIATGKRVVLNGENSSWAEWNNSLMAVLGGTVTPACVSGGPVTNSVSPLTDGLSSIYAACGSSTATGARTDLTANGVASVWGASNNVLLMLDGNWVQNSASNAFAANIGQWLATSSANERETVPVPTTLALFVLGLAGLGYSRRKA